MQQFTYAGKRFIRASGYFSLTRKFYFYRKDNIMRPLYLLFICLCFHAACPAQGAAPGEHETKIQKVLENKSDQDFEFYRGGGQTSSFKYFLRNDTIWFAGSNIYTTVIPLANVDFDRKMYFFESSLYKTKTGSKCIEVSLWAMKGKQYEKEFEIEAFKAIDDADKPEIATLILPDKAFAEAFVKYLKDRRP
jgi:hypothetical protein